mmetsp:Transcript_25899/g.65859  ORF Transcript_25899/g.65859 Transcript_25899/m.65859 type:complete len:285 (-) Transcript_25899:345-1199(-)|eukprot:CAMPEP_0115862212 /NCGR_PEP_ID=MMETSP0287-20121206/18059_1 /TAXON_ID=412157 /ORGANISM="Chrysochromulina rotalis, Strain UIO044" /LENGTH=284 /DNA_ID=CAMNT_0003316625 /DNA_START=109 /DNA_END=963 /DNA_ORIENTATION=-
MKVVLGRLPSLEAELEGQTPRKKRDRMTGHSVPCVQHLPTHYLSEASSTSVAAAAADRVKERELKHAASERLKSTNERLAAEAAKARRAPISQVVHHSRGVSYEQTRSMGPRWERDHPVPIPALAALAQLDAYKQTQGPVRELPPSTDPPLPKRQKSSRSSVDERIKPLVDFLRELEEREAREGPRSVSPTEQVAEALGALSDSMTVEAHIERILSFRGQCDEAWRSLGLEPGILPPRNLLRKRFLALALKVHPDKCEHPRAREAFMIVDAAFRSLRRSDAAAE